LSSRRVCSALMIGDEWAVGRGRWEENLRDSGIVYGRGER